MPTKALLLTILLPLLALAPSGCGKPLAATVDVSGKLILPTGVKLADKDMTTITFLADGPNTAQGGAVSLNGQETSFTAKVPPGTYKVAVTVQPYPGEKGGEERKRELTKAFGRFSLPTTTGGSAAASVSTNLQYEVTQDAQQTITIDLNKGTISKN